VLSVQFTGKPGTCEEWGRLQKSGEETGRSHPKKAAPAIFHQVSLYHRSSKFYQYPITFLMMQFCPYIFCPFL
jgi:hypothetical protein